VKKGENVKITKKMDMPVLRGKNVPGENEKEVAMRLFEHFPQDDKTRCPICGTADDKPCFLLPIDGTTRDWICEAAPTHADCISERLDKLQYNRDVGIVYMRIANADLERA
jgi:hypothetical protein